MKTIAIIGTGISGMAAGYYLRDKFDITFYEKNNYPGGHTNTLTVDEDGAPVYIDSAFMVYNEFTYPNFVELLNELKVETEPTSMSFSVQHVESGLEYGGAGWSELFAQRRNVLNLSYWSMLLEMDRFNKTCTKILDDPQYLDYSVAQFVKKEKYSKDFTEKFLIPMSSAIWSTEPNQMLDFPVITLVRFFRNHGFLGGLSGHYQWRTVKGGSRMYRDKIMVHFKDKVFLNRAVQKIERHDNGISVIDQTGTKKDFDKVIFACHAPEALSMLGDEMKKEKSVLRHFRYQKNKGTLHTDAAVMPKAKKAWSSWNYRLTKDSQGNPAATTIYDMNSLQRVSQKKNYFISINDPGEVDPKKVLWEAEYDHPIYDVPAVEAQKDLPELNENGQTYFCGAYFNYGFHEDGLVSGKKVAEKILSSQ